MAAIDRITTKYKAVRNPDWKARRTCHLELTTSGQLNQLDDDPKALRAKEAVLTSSQMKATEWRRLIERLVS